MENTAAVLENTAAVWKNTAAVLKNTAAVWGNTAAVWENTAAVRGNTAAVRNCSYTSSAKKSDVATSNGVHSRKLAIKVALVAPKNASRARV